MHTLKRLQKAYDTIPSLPKCGYCKYKSTIKCARCKSPVCDQHSGRGHLSDKCFSCVIDVIEQARDNYHRSRPKDS